MFGPCETCNDALSGYKAACEARVSVRDANRRGSDERKTQPLIAKVLALRLAGDVEGARTLLAQGAAPAFVSWLASVNRLIDLEERLNNESAAQARALTGSFLAWMAVLCAIAVGAGSLGAWFIGRGLMRQLGGQPGYAADIVRSIAAGDLGVRIATAPGDQSSLLFAKASTEIAAGNQDLSNRTENQADTLKDTAASMEELTGTVRQNADNARQANQNATLVEQASAAASLQDEAATLADVVSVFKMEQQAARGVASTPQRPALSLSV